LGEVGLRRGEGEGDSLNGSSGDRGASTDTRLVVSTEIRLGVSVDALRGLSTERRSVTTDVAEGEDRPQREGVTTRAARGKLGLGGGRGTGLVDGDRRGR